MKKIVYPDRRVFVITDSEFAQAYSEWKTGGEYFCDRIDSILTKKYHYIEPEFDDTEFEHRVGEANGEVIHFAYNKKNKELWYAAGWEYGKLLDSVTGQDSFSGLIPKKVESNFDAIFNATELIDDYLDKIEK